LDALTLRSQQFLWPAPRFLATASSISSAKAAWAWFTRLRTRTSIARVFPFARITKDTLDWLDKYLGVPR